MENLLVNSPAWLNKTVIRSDFWSVPSFQSDFQDDISRWIKWAMRLDIVTLPPLLKFRSWEHMQIIIRMYAGYSWSLDTCERRWRMEVNSPKKGSIFELYRCRSMRRKEINRIRWCKKKERKEKRRDYFSLFTAKSRIFRDVLRGRDTWRGQSWKASRFPS